MAYPSTVVAGTSILISEDKATRNLRDAGESLYNLVETTESEVREWVALDYATATAARAAETGNALMTLQNGVGETSVTYESTVSEDNRVIRSYIYTCSAEKKTIAFA